MVPAICREEVHCHKANSENFESAYVENTQDRELEMVVMSCGSPSLGIVTGLRGKVLVAGGL